MAATGHLDEDGPMLFVGPRGGEALRGGRNLLELLSVFAELLPPDRARDTLQARPADREGALRVLTRPIATWVGD